MKWGLHWFRRDLRLPGNNALRENWKQTQGRTLGIFCFDSTFLSRSDFSHNRFGFFLKTLQALQEDWREQGGDLLVVDGQPHDVFVKLLEFCRTHPLSVPSLVTWNRDYEPFARERDQKIEHLLKTQGISFLHSRDHLIFEPDEILKSGKPHDFYQVYSPYARQWQSKLISPQGQERIQAHHKIEDYFRKTERKHNLFTIKWAEFSAHSHFPFSDTLEHFTQSNAKKVTIPLPEAGFFAAFQKLKAFKEKIQFYKETRDFPALEGTSQLSIFLKNGSLTSSQVLQVLSFFKVQEKEEKGGLANPSHPYIQEIAWREFYYALLFHKPSVEKKSFLPQYEDLAWENNTSWFQRWCEGTTGFPIVDAGMRQLSSTGWMHNRVRMIVASFLTKDLLIDWRWGENHFMKELLDGDLAPNNGGWQWAASTGCDPQPYFRIFNPWLQSKKFDPQGTYIRTFIPELKNTPAPLLHDATADRTPWGYPKPIVDHSVQRLKALNLYRH